MALAPTDLPGEDLPRATRGGTVLRRRYEIDPTFALPQFDSPTAQAFAARDQNSPGRKLFALICDPTLPPRSDAMAHFKGAEMRGMLPLVDWGVIDWPPAEQRRTVVVYEQPTGGRMLDALGAGGRIQSHDISRLIIEPLVGLMRNLSSQSFPARAIRPDNLFYLDEERTQLVLGDCVTAPPGYDQPIVFETVERGMAGRIARGLGDLTDDYYALGVSIVVLLLGRDPTAGKSDAEVIFAKIQDGSYATLVGNERIPLTLLEPLRGLLSDDAVQRWTIQQLELWLDGRRLTPMQKKAARKSDRVLQFGGFEHLNVRTLAYVMGAKPAEGIKLIKDGTLETWLLRGMEAKELAASVANAPQWVSIANKDRGLPDDLLLTRVCMLLDPPAPIRYKGVAFMPDGFAPLLAADYIRTGGAQILGEAVIRELVPIWVDIQDPASPPPTGLKRDFTALRSQILLPEPGYGIERCLYELNQSLHCLSPHVIDDHVVEVPELLLALDDAAKRVDTKLLPVDRHVAAFIAARFAHDIEAHLRAFASKEPDISVLGMLSLLAVIQWRMGDKPLLGLASWVGGLLGPALAIYHSRTTRREVEREIPKLVRKGSLPELFNLFENTERRALDLNAYAKAKAEFLAAETEADQLLGEMKNAVASKRIGEQTAAMSSIVIALMILVLMFAV